MTHSAWCSRSWSHSWSELYTLPTYCRVNKYVLLVDYKHWLVMECTRIQDEELWGKISDRSTGALNRTNEWQGTDGGMCEEPQPSEEVWVQGNLSCGSLSSQDICAGGWAPEIAACNRPKGCCKCFGMDSYDSFMTLPTLCPTGWHN